MKNRHSTLLLLITCIFAAFTLGFLAGRTTAPGDVIISSLPQATEASTSPAVVQQIIPAAVQETAASVPESIPVTRESVPETQEVPSEPQESIPETTAETVPAETSGSGLININTATVAQLDTLPGIGPVLAQRIVDYREAHGPFTALSQLTLVEGIGEKRLMNILDLITIE